MLFINPVITYTVDLPPKCTAVTMTILQINEICAHLHGLYNSYIYIDITWKLYIHIGMGGDPGGRGGGIGRFKSSVPAPILTVHYSA